MTGAVIMVGINPGEKTGYALWNAGTQKLVQLASVRLHDAIIGVMDLQKARLLHSVVVADCRARVTSKYALHGKHAILAAGGVLRDLAILEEFLRAQRIRYRRAGPDAAGKKWGPASFARAFNWRAPCPDHVREAALLVAGLALPKADTSPAKDQA